MLASDMNNQNFAGAINPDSVLYVRFYVEKLKNEFESEKQGRPIWYEVPFVEIMRPGDQTSIITTEVRDDHKRRFPMQWSMFQDSQATMQMVGTPVEEWPAISRSQAEELKGLKFFSVEQIADASDLQAQRLGMAGPMLRQKAKAFLASAQDTALAQKQAGDLARKDQEIADLKAMQDRMAKQITELAKNRKKVGRPPNNPKGTYPGPGQLLPLPKAEPAPQQPPEVANE